MELHASSAATTSRIPFVALRSSGRPARHRLDFGEPGSCPREANDAFVDDLLKQMVERYTEKWGFDFMDGEPLPETPMSRFHYEKLESQVVPSLYRSHLLPSLPAVYEENVSDTENALPEPVDLNCLAGAKKFNCLNESCDSSFGWHFKHPTENKLRKPTILKPCTPKKNNQPDISDYMPRRNHPRSEVKSPETPRRRSVRMSPYSYSPRRPSIAS
ncbi:hypothetical protein M3Y98_00598300 [Aphelenchoides besseyi]|nr:hypothetical protein M3Y98_00598300 [Aphelenchoides besseyi]KAI6194047.1 hypothetical protein M3Y96_01083500 [Aphelenchoides besseyi]